MKKFKFKMEGLYKLRKEEERQEMMVMAKLRERETDLNRKMKAIENKRGVWVENYNSVGSSYQKGEDVYLIEQYLSALDLQKIKMEDQMRNLQREIQQELVRLEKAFTARKQVESFKEKQEERWREEIRKKENYILDEMNNIRFIRQQLDSEEIR